MKPSTLRPDAHQDLAVPPLRAVGPNPHLGEFVSARANPCASGYRREPFSGALRSSTRHPAYAFHPYHTKVPPEVIRTLIEHYTEPGDLVLDAFCGSGMTGVAARESGRHAVLVDLSPLACFVAGVNTSSHDWPRIRGVFSALLDASEARLGYLYETREDDGRSLSLAHCVWSDVFRCRECEHRFPFFPHGVVHHGTKVETRRAFPCPGCGAELNVRRIQRVLEDGRKVRQLAWVHAGRGKNRVGRAPNAHDLRLAAEAESLPAAWYPRDAIDPSGYSARLAQLGDKAIADVSRLLSPRNLRVFADLWERVSALEDPAARQLTRAILTSVFTVISERQGYFGGGGGMSGNLYMPIVRAEKNVYAALRRKLKRVDAVEAAKTELSSDVLVSAQSATDLRQIPDGVIDYVYVDPPFGANIIYSELNLLLEAWLGVRTEASLEAVIDPSRARGAEDYADLMRRSFGEIYRVLKPGRWLTVEFHNTDPRVWNLLQEAIGQSGFVVAHAGVFDKGSTTILGDIRPGSAKHDILISAHKPVEKRTRTPFRLGQSRREDLWSWLEEHLAGLPRPVGAEVVAERTRHYLFDRMVAFHLRGGLEVPLSTAAFYAELERRFAFRGEMFFRLARDVESPAQEG